MGKEGLTSEYREQLTLLVKQQIPDILSTISVTNYDNHRLEYVSDLMQLAILENTYQLDIEAQEKFKRVVKKYRNSGEEGAIVDAENLLSNYYLQTNNPDRSKLYLQDALIDAQVSIVDPEERNSKAVTILGDYIHLAISLNKPEIAKDALEAHGEMFNSIDPKHQLRSPLFALAMESIPHPEVFETLVGRCLEAGHTDIVHLLRARLQISMGNIAPSELMGILQNIKSGEIHAYAYLQLARLGFEEGNEEFGDIFLGKLKALLLTANGELPLDQAVGISSVAIQEIYAYRKEDGMDLLQMALSDISRISNFPKMERAYIQLFRAMTHIADQVQSIEDIPVDMLNLLREHALNRFANQSNFLDTESSFALSLFPKIPDQAEALLEHLSERQATMLDHRGKFQILEAMAQLASQMALKCIKYELFDDLSKYVKQQTDIEEEMNNLELLYSDLHRFSYLSSIDKTRSAFALHLASKGDIRAPAVVHEINGATARVSTIWQMHHIANS